MKELAAIFLAITLLVFAGKAPSSDSSGRPTLIPPKDLKHFSLGYHEVSADTLWIRLLQDFDFCEKRGDDMTPAQAAAVICDKGWTFGMLDAITELAPKFHQAYQSGGLALSILVQDIEGAAEIYAKGIRQFPNDGYLAYSAAYHALYEEKNESKAIDLLIRAGNQGAPPWVFALAAKLSAKEGKLQMARDILTQALNGSELKGYGKERVAQRLAEIEKQLAATPESSPKSSSSN